VPKPIPKKFRMPEIPKYNGMTDPNVHVTSYTCAIKVNDLEDDDIESILLKKFQFACGHQHKFALPIPRTACAGKSDRLPRIRTTVKMMGSICE